MDESKGLGLLTLQDILKELKKPGLDPRGVAEAVTFDDTVRSINDLQVGMELWGVVTNITNFGAFVDIGVKQDGLVHISQLGHKFVKNPAEVVALSQRVKVRVVEVDRAQEVVLAKSLPAVKRAWEHSQVLAEQMEEEVEAAEAEQRVLLQLTVELVLLVPLAQEVEVSLQMVAQIAMDQRRSLEDLDL